MSRHNITQATTVLQGKATLGAYQSDKLGVEWTPTYVWRPVGTRAFTATGSLAAGATGLTLSSSWAGPSKLLTITFSDGEQLLGAFVNGNTAVTFYSATIPLVGNPVPAALVNAVTSAISVSNLPPVVGSANAYATSQTVTGAGTAFVLNGALSSGTPAVGTPDVPRNVVAAWTNTAVLTITGTDYYGRIQTEVTSSGTSWTGKKAFATITSVTTSATITGATLGTGNVLGLPFKIISGCVLSAYFNDAADAGTVVVGDETIPATSSSGDVRGTYTPAGTLNGAKFLSLIFKVADTSTQYGAFGVIPA